MHGIPENLVDTATVDQLLVFKEIVERNLKNTINLEASAVNLGVWGSKDN